MANIALELQKLANSAQVQIQKLSNEATEKTFKYNTTEANAARQWQTQMSNTSHQREVADLKAAGLNPILSAGGNGAQSYTTSSASAAAENASQAYSSIASSRLSGLAGVEQSKISAAATRNAAAQNAAAMKAAAAAQASAARYAASMNYLTSKERNEANIKINRESWQAKKDITFNAPTGNPIKLIDKYFGSSSPSTGAESLITRLKSVVKPSINDLTKNPEKYFYKPNNGQPISKDNFQLNVSGYRTIKNRLHELGMNASPSLCNLYVKAFKFGDAKAIRVFKNQYYITKIYQNKAKARAWHSSI